MKISICFVLIILCILSMAIVLPSNSQDPNLDRATESRTSTNNTENSQKELVQNPIFKTGSVLVSLLIFFILCAVIYCIMFVLFKNSIENDNSPLVEFFKYNTIILISWMIFAFICLGNFTYRREKPPENFIDYLSGLNWLIWAIVFIVVVIIIIAMNTLSGKKRSSD